MKKVIYILLASCLLVLASCSSGAGSFGGSITINGTRYEWKAKTEVENRLILECINDIINGSQSLNDNIDYYQNESLEDSNNVITLFTNVYNSLEE